ncbi:MAG: glycosyltransferase family 2 protein, partial [bacterium]
MTAAAMPPELSVVVPVYRGAATVGRLVEALAGLRAALPGGLEIVLVDDGSPDDSAAVCRRLVETAGEVPVVLVEHARNYGEHNAVMTGLRHARGRFVGPMDDDLQNPPEEVLRLLAHCRDNDLDVVYTRYARKEHAWWRNLGSRFANKVADWLLDKPPGLYLSSFRCMSALAAGAVGRYSGPYP